MYMMIDKSHASCNQQLLFFFSLLSIYGRSNKWMKERMKNTTTITSRQRSCENYVSKMKIWKKALLFRLFRFFISNWQLFHESVSNAEMHTVVHSLYWVNESRWCQRTKPAMFVRSDLYGKNYAKKRDWKAMKSQQQQQRLIHKLTKNNFLLIWFEFINFFLKKLIFVGFLVFKQHEKIIYTNNQYGSDILRYLSSTGGKSAGNCWISTYG